MAYLTVKQLNKHYGPTQVFADIDFSADEGEFVTLLGPSGCGKSTLLRCLAGLTAVDSGEIILDGQNLLPVAPQQRGIGMVFQSYALFPNMTVAANVAFGLRRCKSWPPTLSAGAPMRRWWSCRPSPTAIPINFPVVKASGWRWPDRW